MVDNNRGVADIASFTPHDIEMFQEPRSEWTFTARAPISIAELTAGKVPARPKIETGHLIYHDLAQAKLAVFSAKSSGSEGEEFLMVGPSLMAEQVNAILYFAAPYKGFGFDTQDIIDDWTDLYTSSEHTERRKAHARMPGWTLFEESRERILGLLTRNYGQFGFGNQTRNDVVIPVLRWQTDTEGKRKIVLEPMDEKLQYALSQALPQQVSDTSRIDAGLGMMFLAAYSPEQTRWPERAGYKPKSSTKQLIGPTQVLAYACRKVAEEQSDANLVPQDQDVQRSMLLAALDTYVTTGVIPTVAVVGSVPIRHSNKNLEFTTQYIGLQQEYLTKTDAIYKKPETLLYSGMGLQEEKTIIHSKTPNKSIEKNQEPFIAMNPYIYTKLT